MDPTRDNPLLRFSTFWWALTTFLIFGAVLAVIWMFNSSDPMTLEDEAAKPRYETRKLINAAQLVSLPPSAIEAMIPAYSEIISNSKPIAMETPAQVVPGSETSKKLAAAPGVDTSIMDKVPAVEETIDPAVLEAGKAVYLLCGACHGQNGEGGPIAPPLAGSEWVTGPISNLIKIQLRGLQGAITVAGKEYNMPGGMAAVSYQTDEQIASVLTYIRNSFGNKASAVKPEQVVALRSEVGKPQITAAELIKP